MNAPGRLLAQLPGVYHSSEDLRALLGALEAVLCEPREGDEGADPGSPRRDGRQSGSPSLERQIAEIAALFDVVSTRDELAPWLAETRDELLPWLAQWVALSGAAELPLERRRRLVGRIVPLYAWRGTRRYLIELLEFYLPGNTEIRVADEESVGLVVGSARVGVDTWLEHDRPFWFKVTIRMPDIAGAPEFRALGRNEWQERIRRVIELAKPAHTTYDLELAFPESDGLRGAPDAVSV